MTEEEKIIEEMGKIFYVWRTSPEERQESWNNLARWHLSELKKAELGARIYFLNSFLEKLITLKSYPSITSKSENATTKSDKIEDFITELQSELRKMEEGR